MTSLYDRVCVRQSESSEGRNRGHKKSRVLAPPSAEISAGEAGPITETPTNKRSRRRGSSPADEAKRKQTLLARLDTQLAKHKDLLKKDILKKRAFLEKDLQLQIHVSSHFKKISFLPYC